MLGNLSKNAIKKIEGYLKKLGPEAQKRVQEILEDEESDLFDKILKLKELEREMKASRKK